MLDDSGLLNLRRGKNLERYLGINTDQTMPELGPGISRIGTLSNDGYMLKLLYTLDSTGNVKPKGATEFEYVVTLSPIVPIKLLPQAGKRKYRALVSMNPQLQPFGTLVLDPDIGQEVPPIILKSAEKIDLKVIQAIDWFCALYLFT
jgi:hypothetical protein